MALGNFGSCNDITAGDLVIFDKDENFVKSEFDIIKFLYQNASKFAIFLE